MDIRRALDYLDQHANLEKSAVVAGRVEGLSLESMARLMDVLGDPQHAYPVIHVTGTNGKGSVGRMIAELVAAHGLVVGLYSSPHLQRVNERIWWSGDPLLRVDAEGEVFESVVTHGKRALPEEREDFVSDADLIGLDDEGVFARLSEEVHRETVEVTDARPGGSISDDELAAVLTEIADLEPLAGVTPSYFELITAAAFTWFAQVPVDVAVIEVGVLGRFDATNVADAQVAVITNIGQDHTDFTGDWRADIAREKSGIVKRARDASGGARAAASGGARAAESGRIDSFLVLGETDAELRPIFTEVAGEQMWVREHDFEAAVNQVAVGGRLLDIRTPGSVLDELFLPAHGEHQGDNAALAIAAVEAFFARPIDPEVAQVGLGRVRLPARFEIVGRSPLVVIDGAHNPDGAAALADTLAEDFDVVGKRILVVGVLAGRDPAAFLDALGARHADLLIATTPPWVRGLPADELAAIARELGIPAESVTDVGEAIKRARAVAAEEDVIVITGSLYTAGAARDALDLAAP